MTTFFRHYKNRYYQIVGEALDTRDDTLVVVYRTLYPLRVLPLYPPQRRIFRFRTVPRRLRMPPFHPCRVCRAPRRRPVPCCP